MATSRERVLVTLTGPDQPGITATLAGVLEQAGAQVLDIEQVVVQGFLTLCLLLAMPDERTRGVLGELLFASKSLGLNCELRPVQEGEPGARGERSRQRYALTAIGPSLGTGALRALASMLAAHQANIERIGRLSERGLTCIEILLSLPLDVDPAGLKKALLAAAAENGFDFALQRENLYRRSKRLVVMDMDSTLIRIEVIDELARAKGVVDEVSAITRQAMNGEIDFDESLRRRVALLAGLDAKVLDRIAADLPLTEGAELLVRVLKRLGYRTAVISGGFSVPALALQKRLGLDYAYSNALEVQDGALTGKVVGPIVNAQRKADLLELVAHNEGIPLDQTIAIGDGANDLLMLQKAGLGIAFHAKPKLREAAHTAISAGGLDSILYFLGITGRDLEEFR